MTHQMIFEAVDVGDGTGWIPPDPGPMVRAELDRWLPAGVDAAEADTAAREQFAERLPELLPALDRLVKQAGGVPGTVALFAELGLNSPFRACTQTGGVAGTLLRNYDWGLEDDRRVVTSSRILRRVIGVSEGVWGLLDGMNDAGLAVSLTYGGRPVHGPGFGIPVVLRYLLETCETVPQALEVLGRVPIATAQNVTLVDRDQAVTVYLGPDIAPTLAPDACAANHQHLPVSDEQERNSRTGARLAAVRAARASGDPEAVIAALLSPPLYEYWPEDSYGTQYTAAYRPAEGRVTYHWPGQEPWEQSFAAFTPGTRTAGIGGPAAP